MRGERRDLFSGADGAPEPFSFIDMTDLVTQNKSEEETGRYAPASNGVEGDARASRTSF
jgi:hypothetical protein